MPYYAITLRFVIRELINNNNDKEKGDFDWIC